MYQRCLLLIFIQILYTSVPSIANKKCGDCPNWKITPIASNSLGYGYNPYWDVQTQSLFVADFVPEKNQYFYRYDYAQKRLHSATLAGIASGLTGLTFMLPIAGKENRFAISDDKRLLEIQWDGVSPNATTVRTISTIEQDPIYASNHFDSCGIDPKGRLVSGTYRSAGCVRTSDPNGTLYLFQENGQTVPLIRNVNLVGGLTWNKKKNRFYFFDSCTYTIFEYKWSPETGLISGPRPVFTFPPTKTYIPLGMTISCNGNLFVGLYLGFEVVEINPKTGRIVKVIKLPVDSITGATFGGPNMDILFVTTSRSIYFNYFDATLSSDIPSNNTMAGQIFMVTGLNTKGCPGKRLKTFS